jgi:NAD(P)-dependent dehydrogenase (short-subunit alcohol dehydrogenase family)
LTHLQAMSSGEGSSELTVAIVGASGGVGRVVAESLAAAERVTPALLVGGRDLAPVQAFATELGAGAQAAVCDIYDPASLAAFCERADVVVNCAGPYTRVLDRVARAAHAAGAHYVDPGGGAATYRRLEPLAPEIAAASRSFVLNAGLIEGGTGLIAWYASAIAEAAFDETSSLDLYFGDVEEWSPAASEDILADAFDDEALGWYRDGAWKRLGQLAALRAGGRVDLPQPFGAGSFVMPHFRVELTRLATDRPYGRVASFIVPQLSARTLLRWGYIRAVSFVNPKHAAASLAALMRDETKRYGAGSVIQAVIKGRRGGEDAQLRVTESDSRGYWITGVTCALATEAVLGDETAPGLAYLCDAVNPVAFVQALADRGLTIASEIDGAPVDASALVAVDRSRADRQGDGGG